MRFSPRITAWFLPLVLTGFLAGCAHKHPATPAPATAPTIAQPVPVPAPAPQTPAPEPAPTPATTPAPTPAETNQQPAEQPKPPVHHKKPAPKPQPAPAPSGVSAIGQLSSGDSSDLRRQTWDLIGFTERGLNQLNRSLNDQDQKTVAHIREFLRQARQALGTGDIDGAHTLAAKARVLLGELTK